MLTPTPGVFYVICIFVYARRRGRKCINELEREAVHPVQQTEEISSFFHRGMIPYTREWRQWSLVILTFKTKATPSVGHLHSRELSSPAELSMESALTTPIPHSLEQSKITYWKDALPSTSHTFCILLSCSLTSETSQPAVLPKKGSVRLSGVCVPFLKKHRRKLMDQRNLRLIHRK